MPKRTVKTDLYRLIEAGFLARQSMLAPMAQLGLAAGDDAIILTIAEAKKNQLTLTKLATQTGFDPDALHARLARLIEFDQLERCTVGKDHRAGARLTAQGRRSAELLLDHWHQLDTALMDELKPGTRKKLRKVLKRFNALLTLQANSG